VKQPEEWNDFEQTSPEFEARLAQALRPLAAPEGFAERVMARAAQSPAPRARIFAMPSRARMWAVTATAAALLFGGVLGEQSHIRHLRQQAAERQFEAGLSIAAEAMQQTREQMQESGVQLGN
jgi:hypothetical protein